jgi:hypothetical protein
MPLPRFIANDQRVKNSHGFYLENAGGNFERFTANPVMLDNHNPDRLIGCWEGLAVDGDLLTALPVFDEGTELGRERKGQVERGFLKGASIGLYIHAAEYRPNPVTGEPEIYVTSWEMLELSVTPIPSNSGSLSLCIYNSERQPVEGEQLAAHLENIVQLTLNNKNMPSINTGGIQTPATVSLTAPALVALGISEGADSAAISAAVVALSANYEREKTARERLEAEAKAAREKASADMIALAMKEGRITADQRPTYERLAAADFEATKAALEAIPAKTSLSALVKGATGSTSIPAERKAWNLHAWMQNDMAGLRKLKAEDPDAYAEILGRV